MDLMSPRHLKIANLAVLAVLVVAGWLWQGREFALGVLVGGLVAAVNFHLLHLTLKNTIGKVGLNPEEAKGQAKAFFAARQLLRFAALVVIIYLLVSYGWVNIFGLLVGLSTVVLTLILAGINELCKLKHKEANPSHGTSHSLS
jgi:uncharacterized membrane protein YkvI